MSHSQPAPRRRPESSVRSWWRRQREAWRFGAHYPDVPLHREYPLRRPIA